MTCKDCVHFEVCGRTHRRHFADEPLAKMTCKHFKEASRFIELPGRIGATVYCILTPCGGCPAFNEPMTEEYIERCRACEKAEIAEMAFDYEMIPEVGKSVFFDRARAEEELAIWHKKKTDEKEGNEDGTESGNE